MRLHGLLYSSLMICGLWLLVLPPTFSQDPQKKVILLSGGGSVVKNAQRYYHNLERGHQIFQGASIQNLVTNGDPEAPVLFQTKKYHFDDKSVVRMTLNNENLPTVKSVVPVGGIQGASTYEAIKKAMTEDKETHPDQDIIFYVTDHGKKRNHESHIVLWDKKTLSASKLEQIVKKVSKKASLTLLLDECYGGGMLRSLWSKDLTKIHLRHSCGLSAAGPEQLAFSGGGLLQALSIYLKAQPKKHPVSLKELYDYLQTQEEFMTKSHPTLSHQVYLKDYFYQYVASQIRPLSSRYHEEEVEDEHTFSLSEDQNATTSSSDHIMPLFVFPATILRSQCEHQKKLLDKDDWDISSNILIKLKNYKLHLKKQLQPYLKPSFDFDLEKRQVETELLFKRKEEALKKFKQFKQESFQPELEKIIQLQGREDSFTDESQKEQYHHFVLKEWQMANKYKTYTPRIKLPKKHKTKVFTLLHRLQKEKNLAAYRYAQHESLLEDLARLKAIEHILTNKHTEAANVLYHLLKCEEKPLLPLAP